MQAKNARAMPKSAPRPPHRRIAASPHRTPQRSKAMLPRVNSCRRQQLRASTVVGVNSWPQRSKTMPPRSI
jgi:hypothetical protein